QKIVNQAVGGLGFVAHSPIVPNTWAYKTDVKQYGYDPEKAKVLLDAAGWKLGADGVRAKDGTKMSFALLTNDDKSRIRCAEEVARQFRLLGIDVKVSASGYTGLIQNFLIPRKFDAILYGLSTGGDPDPYSWWHSTQAKPDGFNFSSFSNKRADDLLEAARQTSDRQKRIANYDEFQSIFADEVPSLLLYYPAYAYAIDSLVKGPDFGVIFDSSSRFLNITDWYVRTKRTMFMTK
ncbi:MAG: ABC transporter substrate-binding protein, partial [Dehalococcoidia bacterium]|nr:ABC transporter substrate-binding protein [Dehalococcoidia bacterium]